MKNPESTVRVGDAVQYSDMANVPVVYLVTASPTPANYGEFTLMDVTGEVTTSDLRQSGWVALVPVSA